MLSSHRLDAGEVSLAGRDWGGDRDPEMLARLSGFHGYIGKPVAERLVAQGRHAFSFDFRGHGDSDAPDESYSWNHFADDVLAVTEHLGLTGDPTLLACGHSKGGASLLLGEAKQPGTYARFWIYEPIVFPAEPPPNPGFDLAASARKRRNEFRSKEE